MGAKINFRAWQLRTTLVIGVLLPPAVMLILAIATDAPLWGGATGPVNVFGTLLMFFWYGIPISYVFGFVPALIAAAVYCGLLTLKPRLIPRGVIRAFMAAVIGAVVGVLWSYFRSETAPLSLGTAAAAVLALLALRWPRPRPLPRSR